MAQHACRSASFAHLRPWDCRVSPDRPIRDLCPMLKGGLQATQRQPALAATA